jgi:phosphotransferase system  glucose/maltose/N-acetylglucosamine-specific IIC component
MFFKKKSSWYWLTFWALIFATFIYFISRFFLICVDKEPKENKIKTKQEDRSSWEELFV